MTPQELSLIQPIVIVAMVITGVLLICGGVAVMSYLTDSGFFSMKREESRLNVEKLKLQHQAKIGEIIYTPKAED